MTHRSFISEDFLLRNDYAQKLYYEYAVKQLSF